ncbi:MAG: HAD hydrolase family protein [Thermaerobacter sp.]|nr:HAD hydrolase family protein [Thermaerobacter sp.]
MRGEVRLVALDVDGTLLDSRGRLSARVRQAVGRATAAGVRVTLATGRWPSLSLPLARELALDTPLVLCGGALVLRPAGEVLHRQEVPEGPFGRAVALLRRLGLPRLALSGADAAADVYCEELLPERVWAAVLRRGCSGWVRVADLAAEVPAPLRLFTWGPPERLREAARRLAKLPLAVRVLSRVEADMASVLGSAASGAAFRGVAGLELTAPGVSKARGLSFLLGLLELDPRQVLAVGNDHNDRELLRYAGWGVAVGNAVPELKALAREVTASNDEDGVALILEKYVA